MKWLLPMVSVVLAGCVDTDSPKFAQQSDATCRGYGAVPGTDMYVACRMRLTEMQVAENNRKKTAFSESMDDLSKIGERERDRQALIAAARESRRMNCNSTVSGPYISTNCY